MSALKESSAKSGHAKRAEPLLRNANARASQYVIDLIDRVNSKLPDSWSDQVMEKRLLGKDCGGESLMNYRTGKSPGDVKFIAERLADALALRMIDRDAFGVLQRDGGHRATLPLRRILARAKGGARITPADIENELAAFFRAKEALDARANEEFLAVESAKLRLSDDLVVLAQLTSARATYLKRRNARNCVLRSINHLMSVLDGLRTMIWEAKHPDLAEPIEFEGWPSVMPEVSFEWRLQALQAALPDKASRKGHSADGLIRFAEMVQSVQARHHFELNGDLPDPNEGDEDNTVFAAIAAKRCRFKPIGSTAELNSRPSTAHAK